MFNDDFDSLNEPVDALWIGNPVNDVLGAATLSDIEERIDSILDLANARGITNIWMENCPPFRNHSSWTQARQDDCDALNNVIYPSRRSRTRIADIKNMLDTTGDDAIQPEFNPTGDGLHPGPGDGWDTYVAFYRSQLGCG